MTTVIKVDNAVREFNSKIGILKQKKKKIHALCGISFEVQEGQIFGLLGPNGAGKTTTIKILTTLLHPTSGSVKVLGYDVIKEAARIRPHINFVFGGERGLYWRLSGYDNLDYYADLYKVDSQTKKRRIEELLELVGMTERAHEKIENYSKGMKQKLLIARGLINDPKILFLDEPTIGLDPNAAIVLRQLIKNLAEQGTTVFLTTHYMNEADELCDQIAIINNGQIVVNGSPDSLKKGITTIPKIKIEVRNMSEDSLNKLKTFFGDVNFRHTVRGNISHLLVNQNYHSDADESKNILNLLEDQEIISYNVLSQSLEESYLHYVGAL